MRIMPTLNNSPPITLATDPITKHAGFFHNRLQEWFEKMVDLVMSKLDYNSELNQTGYQDLISYKQVPLSQTPPELLQH
ncbi:MAG: hypothetical protein M3162_07555 [Thermoproteota archaeon]|nr:hypothetical protein [Thermoproteota archaeon]